MRKRTCCLVVWLGLLWGGAVAGQGLGTDSLVAARRALFQEGDLPHAEALLLWLLEPGSEIPARVKASALLLRAGVVFDQDSTAAENLIRDAFRLDSATDLQAVTDDFGMRFAAVVHATIEAMMREGPAGSVVIFSALPERARLLVDDTVRLPPFRMALHAGPHHMAVTAEGYLALRDSFSVMAGDSLVLPIAMRPAVGWVSVNAVPYAEVVVGGQTHSTPVIELEVPAGSGVLTVERTGYRTRSRVIFVRAGEHLSLGAVQLVALGVSGERRFRDRIAAASHGLGALLAAVDSLRAAKVDTIARSLEPQNGADSASRREALRLTLLGVIAAYSGDDSLAAARFRQALGVDGTLRLSRDDFTPAVAHLFERVRASSPSVLVAAEPQDSNGMEGEGHDPARSPTMAGSGAQLVLIGLGGITPAFSYSHLSAGLLINVTGPRVGLVGMGTAGRDARYESRMVGGAASVKLVHAGHLSGSIFAGYGYYWEQSAGGNLATAFGVLGGGMIGFSIKGIHFLALGSDLVGRRPDAGGARDLFYVPQYAIGLGINVGL